MDVGDVGDDLAVGQIGHGDVAHQSDNGNHREGDQIAEHHPMLLLALEGARGEHHQRYHQEGKLFADVVEAIGNIGRGQEPEQMHTHQDEEGLEQIIAAKIGKLALEVGFYEPVHAQEHPCHVHDKVGGGQSHHQQAEQHKIKETVDLETFHRQFFFGKRRS